MKILIAPILAGVVLFAPGTHADESAKAHWVKIGPIGEQALPVQSIFYYDANLSSR
jgi:hypothetical protein